MAYPTDRKYTKDHEWIRLAGDTAEIGITDYAQQQLGDVVFVELPEVGQDDRGRRVVRIDRIGQGGVRAVRADERRSGRGEPGAAGSSGGREQRSARDVDGEVQVSNPRRRDRSSIPRLMKGSSPDARRPPTTDARCTADRPRPTRLRRGGLVCQPPHRSLARRARRDAARGRRGLARRAHRRGHPGVHPARASR